MVKESRLNPDEIMHSQIVLGPSGRPPCPPPDLRKGERDMWGLYV